MVEKALESMAVNKLLKRIITHVIDLPGNFLNGWFYFMGVAIVPAGISLITESRSFHEVLAYIAIMLLFSGSALNAVIQNFSFDKKFRHILDEHKDLYFDVTFFPARWMLKVGVMRGMVYTASVLFAASAFYKRFKRPSIVPIVNYLANIREFQENIKPINLLTAWTLVIVVVVIFPLTGICVGILKYFF